MTNFLSSFLFTFHKVDGKNHLRTICANNLNKKLHKKLRMKNTKRKQKRKKATKIYVHQTSNKTKQKKVAEEKLYANFTFLERRITEKFIYAFFIFLRSTQPKRRQDVAEKKNILNSKCGSSSSQSGPEINVPDDIHEHAQTHTRK